MKIDTKQTNSTLYKFEEKIYRLFIEKKTENRHITHNSVEIKTQEKTQSEEGKIGSKYKEYLQKNKIKKRLIKSFIS